MKKLAFAFAFAAVVTAATMATSAFAAPPELKLPEGWAVEEGVTNFEAQYQPPKVGTKYTLVHSVVGEDVQSVMATDGFSVTLKGKDSECDSYAKLIPCSSGFYSTYKKDQLQAAWPMKIGTSYEYTRYGNTGWTAQTKVKVVGSKIVTTPFGKFEAFEMEFENPGLFQNSESADGRYLYAPSLGVNLAENFHVFQGRRAGYLSQRYLSGVASSN